MLQIYNKLLLIGKRKFVILSISATVILLILISLLFSLVFESHQDISFIKDWSNTKIFVITVLITPFIETFLFQTLIIEFWLNKKLKNSGRRLLYLILIPTLIFSFFHIYSISYFIGSLMLGFIFSFLYIIAMDRKDINAFLFVSLIHIIINLIAFINNDLLNIDI